MACRINHHKMPVEIAMNTSLQHSLNYSLLKQLRIQKSGNSIRTEKFGFFYSTPEVISENTGKSRISTIVAMSSDEKTFPSLELLSGRERRKIKQERRQQKTVMKKEAQENEPTKPKRVVKVKDEDLMELKQLEERGLEWYILRIAAAGETTTLADIKAMMAAEFPDVEYELFYPTIPSTKVTSRGKLSTSPMKLQPGSVYLHVTLTRAIYDKLKQVQRVQGFYGRKIGKLQKEMVLPFPIMEREVEARRQQVAEGYAAYEKVRLELEKENEALKLLPKEDKKKAMKKKLGAGMKIKIIKGPYQNFTGRIEEINPKLQRVKATVIVFSEPTPVDLHLDQIELLR